MTDGLFAVFSVQNPHCIDEGSEVSWGGVGCCPDARFARVTSKHACQMAGVLEGERSNYRVDPVTLLGGSKAILDVETRTYSLDVIEDLAGMHRWDWLLLADHEDCGKWRRLLRESEMTDQQFHFNRLREAYPIVKKRFTQLHIVLAYACGVGRDVTFMPVTPFG